MASPYSTGYATNSGFVTGDSLVTYEFDVPLRNYLVAIENRASGGKGFVGGSFPTITDQWNTFWPNRQANCDFVILQGGVNDIKSFGISVSAMQTAFQLLLDDAIADVGADRTIVWNIAPWGNHVAWTSAHQTSTETWNTWLAAQAISQGFILIDMYDLLGDDVNPENMAAAFDIGDGIHPSAAGVEVQYEATLAALEDNNLLNIVNRMNTMKKWVGAVEPTGREGSGNNLEYWVGAVQPAHVGGVVSQGKTVGANYVLDRPSYGLVLLDRSLTSSEETQLYAYLDGNAGV